MLACIACFPALHSWRRWFLLSLQIPLQAQGEHIHTGSFPPHPNQLLVLCWICVCSPVWVCACALLSWGGRCKVEFREAAQTKWTPGITFTFSRTGKLPTRTHNFFSLQLRNDLDEHALPSISRSVLSCLFATWYFFLFITATLSWHFPLLIYTQSLPR